VLRPGIGDGPLRCDDDRLVRRSVGVADAERDHVSAGGALRGDLSLQLREKVGGICSSRLLGCIQLLDQKVRELAGEDRHRPPRQVDVEILSHLDTQLAAIESHRYGLSPPRSTCATAAPHAPVPDDSVSPTPRS